MVVPKEEVERLAEKYEEQITEAFESVEAYYGGSPGILWGFESVFLIIAKLTERIEELEEAAQNEH